MSRKGFRRVGRAVDLGNDRIQRASATGRRADSPAGTRHHVAPPCPTADDRSTSRDDSSASRCRLGRPRALARKDRSCEPHDVDDNNSHPDAADARGGDRQRLLAQFIRHPPLAPRRLGHRHLHNGLFHFRRDPILQNWFLAGDLLQHGLTARLIEFLEAIEAVSALRHHATCLRDMGELLRQLQHIDLHLDDLLFRRHHPRSFREGEDSI